MIKCTSLSRFVVIVLCSVFYVRNNFTFSIVEHTSKIVMIAWRQGHREIVMLGFSCVFFSCRLRSASSILRSDLRFVLDVISFRPVKWNANAFLSDFVVGCCEASPPLVCPRLHTGISRVRTRIEQWFTHEQGARFRKGPLYGSCFDDAMPICFSKNFFVKNVLWGICDTAESSQFRETPPRPEWDLAGRPGP